MRHANATAAALAAALLAGCGQPLLSAELEVPEIRITQPGIVFDPQVSTTALCQPGVPGCVFNDLAFDVGAEIPAFDEPGVTLDLRLLDVGFHFTGGDLSFLKEVRVLLAAPGGGGYTEIASYVKPAGTTPTDVMVSGRANLDIGPYLSAGVLPLRLELDYEGLPGAFTADIGAGFSVVVTLDYETVFNL
jgi:hypothetical protein